MASSEQADESLARQVARGTRTAAARWRQPGRALAVLSLACLALSPADRSGAEQSFLVPVLAGGMAPPIQALPPSVRSFVPAQSEGTAGARPQVRDAGSGAEPTEEEIAWARAAWAYFAGPAPAAPPAGPPADATADGGPATPGPGAAPTPPPGEALLVPVRSGATVATAFSIGDQVAALVLARRLGIVEAREFDRRLSRLLDFLGWMPLASGMPNRFYDTSSGAALGADFQPGVAGWSAVDTGRLLLWLRIAAEEHPEFASFIRHAVGRLSVCDVVSPEGRLLAATPAPEGLQYAPETTRGYDAVAAQGYRAWGLDLPLPAAAEASPFEIEVEGIRFPLVEDLGNQAPVMTTPPAYLGLELGFEPIGGTDDAVAGGRGAGALMTAVRDAQAARAAATGIPTARADFRRSEDPLTVWSTVLANGYPWTTVLPDGSAAEGLALISTRAAFALDAFFDGEDVDRLMLLVRELHDPAQGWFEGRYERAGGWEATRTSATNAFVLEALAYRVSGPLLPEDARPEALTAVAPDASGACRLPLATPEP